MNRILSAKQVARIWRVSPDTIIKWAHAGELPHKRVGRFLLFAEDQVWADIAARTEQVTA